MMEISYAGYSGLSDYKIENMVVVEFPSENYKLFGFYNVIKETRKFSTGTWGYSDCPIRYKSDVGLVYFFFDNTDDLLVFKLRLSLKMTHVNIWPDRLKFFIYSKDDK